MPKDKEVQELKKLSKEHFGMEMTDDEALDAAIRLVHFFVLTSPELFRLYSPDDRTS